MGVEMRTQSEEYEINQQHNINSYIRQAELDLIHKEDARTKEQRMLDEFYSKQDYSGVKS